MEKLEIKNIKNSINDYPIFIDGHVTNLVNIQKVKTLHYSEIKRINELIKNGWIYLTLFPDSTLVLGKPK